MLLRNFQHTLIFEQWASCAAQRAVRGNMDTLVFAEIDDFLLRQKRVVLDLVRGWCDGRFREQPLHVLDRVVCDADCLDFVWVLVDELLHILPCLDVGDAVVDVAGAVFEFGEEGVVSYERQPALHKPDDSENCAPFGFIGTGQCTR